MKKHEYKSKNKSLKHWVTLLLNINDKTSFAKYICFAPCIV